MVVRYFADDRSAVFGNLSGDGLKCFVMSNLQMVYSCKELEKLEPEWLEIELTMICRQTAFFTAFLTSRRYVMNPFLPRDNNTLISRNSVLCPAQGSCDSARDQTSDPKGL